MGSAQQGAELGLRRAGPSAAAFLRGPARRAVYSKRAEPPRRVTLGFLERGATLGGNMPLYNLFAYAKPVLGINELHRIVKRAANHVYDGNGVVTDVVGYGVTKLAYPILQAGKRYEHAKIWQLGFVAKPSVLHDIEKQMKEDDRILRRVILKSRLLPSHKEIKQRKRWEARQARRREENENFDKGFEDPRDADVIRP